MGTGCGQAAFAPPLQAVLQISRNERRKRPFSTLSFCVSPELPAVSDQPGQAGTLAPCFSSGQPLTDAYLLGVPGSGAVRHASAEAFQMDERWRRGRNRGEGVRSFPRPGRLLPLTPNSTLHLWKAGPRHPTSTRSPPGAASPHPPAESATPSVARMPRPSQVSPPAS